MKNYIKQAEALEKLLNHCTTEGDSYKPSDAAMNSTALQTLLEESRKSIQAVHNAKNDLVDLVNIRHRAFDPLPQLGTRIIRALKAAKAKPDLIEDVNRIRQRFRSLSSGTIPDSAQENGPGEQTGQPGSGVENPSSKAPRGPISQLGFSSKEENFAEMIGLLKKEPAYAPNEFDLSIEGLEAKLEALHTCNTEVSKAFVALQKARKKCRQMVYGEEGIYGIGMRVKDYYISAFGYNDEKFKMVSKIKFVK